LKMITHRIGFFDGNPESRPADVYGYTTAKDRDDLLDKLKQIPFKSPHVAEVAASLSSVEMDSAWIDVSRLMQRHPFITHADARVSRAYRIFRTMGLRHLYVTPDKPLVVGVMTRKDVIQENTSLTLGEKAERIMAERRSGGGGGGGGGGTFIDGEAEGADAFPGGANLYSQDYADRFKSKQSEPSARGVDERGGGASANDHWNDQFDDDDDHHPDDDGDERLPYIPYYQGNAGEDDDDDDDDHANGARNGGSTNDGVGNNADGGGGGAGFTNISGASIVRRANGPDNL